MNPASGELIWVYSNVEKHSAAFSHPLIKTYVTFLSNSALKGTQEILSYPISILNGFYEFTLFKGATLSCFYVNNFLCLKEYSNKFPLMSNRKIPFTRSEFSAFIAITVFSIKWLWLALKVVVSISSVYEYWLKLWWKFTV